MADNPWVDGLTIGQVLRETANRFPDRDAVIFSQTDVRLNWSQFDEAVDQTAKALLALGFQHGHHFGVWATNWPEWVLLQFATARIGVVLVTINPSYRPTELAYAMAQSDIRGLALIDRFRTTDYDEVLSQGCPEFRSSKPGELNSNEFPKLKWLIRMRGTDHPSMLSWQQFCEVAEDVAASALKKAQEAPRPGDPINLQYTSGTTGLPKGSLLTHRNLLLNAFYTGECQRFDESDRIGITVPLYHCFGCVLGTMCAAIYGAAMVFPHEYFQPAESLDAIEAERCTAIYGVPTMFIAMLEDASFAERDTSSLRTGIMAGSPCPIELMKRVTHDMGADEITIAYGQTEASPLITMTRTDDPLEKRVGTVGRTIPDVEVKVVDPDTGKQVPDGVSGELYARGHNIMLGYYNQPELTAAAIDSDGWLHTGDMSLREPDGYYRITGRIKDLIIRGGENISPREIEELLYQHAAVEDVQVVGVPDQKFGEEILVCIKPRPGESASEDDIRDFCRARLAHFKTPRYVWFVDSFPTTVTGKIQKFKLREQAIGHFGLQDAADIETA